MLEDFQDRYSSPAITEILNIAAFLDPQFKELDPFIPVNERVDMKECVNYNYLCLLLLLQKKVTGDLGKLQPAAVWPLIPL